MSKEKNFYSGVGLSGLLFVAFLVMKLAGIGAVAHWSWWWVTAPLWAPVAFVLVIYGGAVLTLLLFEVLGLYERPKKKVSNTPARTSWEQRLKEMQGKHKQQRNQQALDEFINGDFPKNQ